MHANMRGHRSEACVYECMCVCVYVLLSVYKFSVLCVYVAACVQHFECCLWNSVPVQELVAAGHYASSEVQSRLGSLAEEHNNLLDTWKKRRDLFSQSHTLQLFLRDAEQRDTWISNQEAFLSNEALGVSISCL